MKNIYIIIISLFGLTLISCAKINSAMDDVNKKYDEFSKESDEPKRLVLALKKQVLKKYHHSASFLFLLVKMELSLPPLKETNGLKGLPDLKVNSEQLPMEKTT